MTTSAQLIELDDVGQRADGFTLDVLNTNRTPLAKTINVSASSAPTVQVDSGRTTIRTLTGVSIDTPPADLDQYRTRLQPILTLPDGSRWDLGIFMFGTDARDEYSTSEIWTPDLFDETFLFDQDLDRSVSLAAGDSVLSKFVELASEILAPLGIPWQYDVSDVACASPVTWRVSSPRSTALASMATMLGALPPFFGNQGMHRLKYPPNANSTPDHIYTSGTRITEGTGKKTNSLYKAPNQYIVTGDDVGGASVRGIYNLPPEAPNSYANTGRVVTAPSHSVPGLSDPAIAQQIAYIDALTDRTTYATASFGAVADPRHDVFDTVLYRDVLYLETGWTMPMSSGADMVHSLTRMWQAA